MAQPEMSKWPLSLCALLAVGAPFACRQHSEAEPAPTRSDMVPATATAAVAPPINATPKPSIVHIVQDGETLWDIARAYGVSVDAILAASGKSQQDARRLSKGSELRIPGA